MKISKRILRQAIAAVEADENTGFCLACGCEHDAIEPDAQEYECDSCGEMQVYGAELIVISAV